MKKILSVGNNHMSEGNQAYKMYGCTCGNCGTVFTFDSNDIMKPRCIDPKPEDCSVFCPNCKCMLSIKQCVEFKSNDEKHEFEIKYDE